MNEDDEHDDAPSRRGPLIAMVVVAVMIAGGLWLSHVLRSASQIQDCVMSGRSNCAPVPAPPR